MKIFVFAPWLDVGTPAIFLPLIFGVFSGFLPLPNPFAVTLGILATLVSGLSLVAHDLDPAAGRATPVAGGRVVSVAAARLSMKADRHVVLTRVRDEPIVTPAGAASVPHAQQAQADLLSDSRDRQWCASVYAPPPARARSVSGAILRCQSDSPRLRLSGDL